MSVRRQAVQQLIVSEGVAGTVDDWLPGYQKELAEVKKRRLEPVSAEHMKVLGSEAALETLKIKPPFICPSHRENQCGSFGM